MNQPDPNPQQAKNAGKKGQATTLVTPDKPAKMTRLQFYKQLEAEFDKLATFWSRIIPPKTRLTPDQLKLQAIAAVKRNASLADCAINDILGCVAQGAKLGLKFDMRGQCYMVPRYNKHAKRKVATFQIGYPGLMMLARRSGQIQKIEARAVYTGDTIDYRYGTDPMIIHKPHRGSRGELQGAYAVAWLVNSRHPQFDFLEEEDIERIKASSGDGGDNAMWNGPHAAWMWKKSAIIQLCKLLPSSEDLEEVIRLEELATAGVSQNLHMLIDENADSADDDEDNPGFAGLEFTPDITSADLLGTEEPETVAAE